MKIPIDKILPNPEQPRKDFDKIALSELADSIRDNGLILPISVEESAGGMYILHDGERRWRAAKLAGWVEIEASVIPGLNGTGKELRLVRAMVANLQRADLNPIEEAEAYRKMVDDLGMTRMEIALKIGISGARVSQKLLLLDLEKPIQKLVAAGKLPQDVRTTKALLEIPNTTARLKLAQELANRNATAKASIEAAQRVSGAFAAEKFAVGDIPAMNLAAKKSGEVNRPQWDAFAQVGRLPPWLLVEISARNVCDRCALRQYASKQSCAGCALVEVLCEMIGRTK